MDTIIMQVEEDLSQPSQRAIYQRARYQKLIESQRVYHREYKQQFTDTYARCDVCDRDISILNMKRHYGTKKHINNLKLKE